MNCLQCTRRDARGKRYVQMCEIAHSRHQRNTYTIHLIIIYISRCASKQISLESSNQSRLSKIRHRQLVIQLHSIGGGRSAMLHRSTDIRPTGRSVINQFSYRSNREALEIWTFCDRANGGYMQCPLKRTHVLDDDREPTEIDDVLIYTHWPAVLALRW